MNGDGANGAEPRPRFFGSLRGRVFAATLAASVAAVGIALLIGVYTTRSAIRDSYRQEVAREASVLASRLADVAGRLQPDETRNGEFLPKQLMEQLRDGGAPGQAPGGQPTGAAGNARPGNASPPNRGGPATGAVGRAPNVRAQPSPSGADRRGSPPLVLPVSLASTTLPATAAGRVNAGKSSAGVTEIGGRSVIFATSPVGGRNLFVLATRPDSIAAGDFNRYITGLVLAALAAAALSAAAAALLARRLTRPIGDAISATSAIAAGRRPERLSESSTAELGELARSVNEMADQLSRAREAERTVLMSASHELRTPLTAISGYAEGIEDGTIDAKQGASVILSESNRLESLVQDLLVLARLEQGTFETHSAPVDLADMARTARDRLALRAETGGVRLRVAGDASPAFADHGRVLQVVTNLVDNAVRVTPRGGSVTIETGPGLVVVSDTGPGIPAADLPHVFERFHLRRRRGMGSPDGSGIGLAIARELTEAMGGAIAVRSQLGSGTAFTVTLPVSGAPKG